MTAPSLELDQVLLGEFLDESLEMLAGIDELVVQLEFAPQDMEIVQAIFRPAHSIKGNSSFFGMFGVKNLAHELETLLDQVRTGQRGVDAPLISLLLVGLDELKAMFQRMRQGGEEIADAEELEALTERIATYARSHADERGSWDEVATCLARLEAELSETASARSAMAALKQALQGMGAAMPAEASPRLDLAEVGGPLADLGQLLDRLAAAEEPGDDASQELEGALRSCREQAETEDALAAVDEMLQVYQTITCAMGLEPIVFELLQEKLEVLPPDGFAPPPLQAREVHPEFASAMEKPQRPAKPVSRNPSLPVEQQKTMRVSEGKIDEFLSLVGELLVVGDMFEHMHQRLHERPECRELAVLLRRSNETFSSLSAKLRKSVMTIRKVEARRLLRKVPRLVRDITSATGKQIEVTLSGEETSIDKSLLDLLDSPLVHMVRNAADHGIESPELRLERGKPAQGSVHVSVEETDTAIVMCVVDDGGGLDLEAIGAKALELGLIQAGQQLETETLIQFLFRSGVSTAREVTDVSGRGVGMDVAKRSVEEAGGSLSVETESGVGSTFRISLPKNVTTEIIAGYLVEAGEQCFILPIESVRETAHVHQSAISTVANRGRCLVWHDRVFPAHDLTQLLGLRQDARAGAAGVELQDPERVSVVLLESKCKKESFALIVNQVLGVQQVVLRPIEGDISICAAVTGAALRGDGSVALMLEPRELAGLGS